ncbi:hypothetical protein MASR1M50_09220 [Burkholderiales bacterium]
MSTNPTIQKAVSYRRSSIQPKPSKTLQQLVKSALTAHAKPAARYEPLNSASTELRFIGHYQTIKGCLCGYLTSFERGAAQPIVSDDPVATALRLGAMHPPKPGKTGAQDQFVPGVLYFVVSGDHVVVAQSASMRVKALENHLNWLLKSKTSELPATSSFCLSDEAQKATKAKIRQSHVRAISFGQPLMEPLPDASEGAPAANAVAVSGPATAGRTSKAKKAQQERQFRPTGPVLEMLKGIFGSDKEFEKLGLDQVFDGNLEVWIQIRYPKRSRRRPEDAVALMDTLGVALRDVEGDSVSLELADGNTVSGKELKISGQVEAPSLNNRLPDESVLWDNMVTWLKDQLENGTIDP